MKLTWNRAEGMHLQKILSQGYQVVKKSSPYPIFKLCLGLYKNIATVKLHEHLVYFLNELIRVAEQAGIKMIIHPGDPLSLCLICL